MIYVFALTLRLAVAVVLIMAALAKLANFREFQRTVQALMPWRRAASASAVVIVATEGTLAGLLSAGVLVNAVAFATLALLTGFMVLSLWATHRGLRIPCNCFGRSDRELGMDSLLTSGLLAGATLAYWALLQLAESSIAVGELPLVAGLGIAAVLGARWLLVAGELTRIVRQRRRLERDLMESTRAMAR